MIDDKILELYNSRRILLMELLDGVKKLTESGIIVGHGNGETDDIIDEMSSVTNLIGDLCNGDYILVDMYRRLSLAIAKENYEEASLVKSEIINHSQ